MANNAQKLTGTYTYGEGYPVAVIGKSVPFEMEWTETNGQISGTCTDIDDLNQTAVIEGIIEQNFITFVKTYPCLMEIDEDGNSMLYENEPSQEVHYTGNYIDNHYEGKWEIVTVFMFEDGNLGKYNCGGSWVLHKK